MFERYTENARKAIYFAKMEAFLRDSSQIDTKDLLMGLTYNLYPEGSPFIMLHTRSEELRKLVGSTIEKSPTKEELASAKDIPLASKSKMVLTYAGKEVDQDRQFSLEPHHLLRGLVRVGDPTSEILIKLGWNLETLRAQSKEHRKQFPFKRPPLRRVLKYYWRLIAWGIAFLLLGLIIFYMRWQQR